MGFTIHYDPRLIEETVALLMRREPGAEYWRERDSVYAQADPEEREQGFRALHEREFRRRGLDRPLARTLAEEPLIAGALESCRALFCVTRKEEGADIAVARGPGPSRHLLLRLRPESLIEGNGLVPFLRRELLHVRDMVDPAFGYDPTPPVFDGAPALQKLILARYRVLWDVTVDGRLRRRAHAGAEERRRVGEEFARHFGMLGVRVGEAFQRLVDFLQPTHAMLLEAASEPWSLLEPAGRRPQSRSHCSLCACPRIDDAPVAALAARLAPFVRADFPAWCEEDPVCPQCVELYRARAILAGGAVR